VPQGDENALQAAVLNGTVFVLIDGMDPAFIFYNGGIFSSDKCDKARVNHALQLVGYGTTTNSVEYWIAKNSWSNKAIFK
jgi:hypothetical protein